MPYLHPEALSPDPTYGRDTVTGADNLQMATLHPARLVRAVPDAPAVAEWARSLDLFRPAPLLRIDPGPGSQAEIFVDFTTEIDAELAIVIDAPGPFDLLLYQGESIAEAEGWVRANHPPVLSSRHLPGSGERSLVFPARGFRFVRILLHGLTGRMELRRLEAHATWTFAKRDGDFRCSDARFQRVWQTSIYTARLCTRPDTIWDGIKRDRVGWFGDARIIKDATDQVFFDPRPAEVMLLSLPLDTWANGVPNYSFDGIAMLHEHVLLYGIGRECVRPAFDRAVAFLTWVEKTQTGADGFLIRDEKLKFFFDIGFLDWSEMPSGGRFEELSWLQAKYVEGLRLAAQVALWLGEADQAEAWGRRAASLQASICRKFWRDGIGFLHTLNHIGPVENPHFPGYGGHYRKTYLEGLRLGPSGPTRQANALAVWAGLADPDMLRTIREKVFDNASLPPVITPYFAYYEQGARARCGDAAGALLCFRDYIGEMLEREDAATLWESWNPQIHDMRRFASHFEIDYDWPTSLCHGWGAGAVPFATRLLMGIQPLKPGYRSVSLNPCLEVPWSYQASVPTPWGPIRIERGGAGEVPFYRIPREIEVEASASGVRIEHG